MPTKYKIFLGKGVLPPYNPRQRTGSLRTSRSQTVLSTIQNGMTSMHKRAQRWGGGGGQGLLCPPPPPFLMTLEMSHSRELMESLVEMVQIENSLQNYVNFTLWNRFSWAFKTLKPMSFRGSGGLLPLWTPGATMDSPMKTVQIDNLVRNYMWNLPPILPSEMGFPGL